ncbi:MAG: hypothetical protein HC813_00020 [Planctomycetes bacterium]|nr:hypothetical protein [Planctomycetota bacterium]
MISLYYYLCIVKRVYMHEPADGEGATPITVGGGLKTMLVVCLAGMFLLGIFMRPFQELAESAASALVAAP